MANTVPAQERVVDPFASYNSNVINKLTGVVSHGEEGLLTVNSLQVEKVTDSRVVVLPGFVIKNDVLINITEPHEVNIHDVDQWESPPVPLFPTGYHFLVLKYEYRKQRPAPKAKIKILKPGERHFLFDNDSEYFLLKVLLLATPPDPLISELYDYDPNPHPLYPLKRKYLKYYAGGEVDLDVGTHTDNDTGRIAYDVLRDKFFFGHASDWQELTAGGVAVDINTDSTAVTSAGQLCYVDNNEEVVPAISTSLETGADLCVLTLSDPITGPGRGIVSGFADNVPVESGIDISPGNIIYLSATEAGKITNVRPSGFFQVVGRSLKAANDVNPATIIFSPKLMISLSNSGTIDSWAPAGGGLYSSEISLAFMDTTALTVVDSHWFDATSNIEIIPERIELFNNGQALRVYMTNDTTVLNYMIQSPASAMVAGGGGGGGGGGGTSDHAQLLNLPYNNSGHTGFTPDPHDNAYHSETYATVGDLGFVDAVTLEGEDKNYYTNATNLATGTIPAARGAIASENKITFLHYNGHSKLPGALYGGVDAPNALIRLNYDGNFYANDITALSNFYGNGSGLTDLNAHNLASGLVHSDRGAAASQSSPTFLRYTGFIRSLGCLYGSTTNPVNSTRLNYDGNFHAANFVAVGSITTGADSVFNGVSVGRGPSNNPSNTIVGSSALSSSSGVRNTAIGYLAMETGTFGSDNVAVGYLALRQCRSNDNVGVGYVALSNATTGHSNTAIGYEALRNCTTARDCIGIGASAARNVSTGSNNIGIGTWALSIVQTSSSNVAIGNYSGSNIGSGYSNVSLGNSSLRTITSGYGNVAVGGLAMGIDSFGGTGYNNTAIGYLAGYRIGNGTINTCVGYAAGYDLTTGSNNVLIGNQAGRPTHPFAIITESNRIVIGNNSSTNAYVKVGWTWPSDIRDKMDISSVPYGLNFIKSINPISYYNKESREVEKPHGPRRFGFSAQEIIALEGDNSVIVDDEHPDRLLFNESHLIPVLVNAIKELSAEVDRLKIKIGEKM